MRIADQRVDMPREVPFIPSFNKWMANVPGTTYFLPVAELSALYINLIFSAFDSDFRFSSLTTKKATSRQVSDNLRALPAATLRMILRGVE